MASICNNELLAKGTPENLKYIEDYFRTNYSYITNDIDELSDSLVKIYFESKWDFPEGIVNDLFNGVPDKDNIYMRCLSSEWDHAYCAFHTCDSNGWYLND